VETLVQDVRFALRMLKKNPGFAAIAILVLAIGIGANTTIFSVVDTILLRPLPYPEPERLVVLENVYKEAGDTSVSYPQYQFWRGQHGIFDQVITYFYSSAALTGLREPEEVRTLRVSANFFPVLGVAPVAGRNFLESEELKSGEPVAMLTESFWRQHYQGSPSALGQKLTLNDNVFTVIGVVPDSFRMGHSAFDLVLPLRLNTVNAPSGLNFLPAIGRLRPGMNMAQARSAIQGVFPSYQKDAQGGADLNSVAITGYQEYLVGDSRPLLLVLFGAVLAVLLIACTNTANLLLARAAAREKEMAIRISLGAGRMRLVRQLLTESVLLSLAGGVLGTLLAWGGLRFLTALLERRLPGGISIHLDARILVFALLLSLATGLVFGTAPALEIMRGKLHDSLKLGGRQSGSSSGGQRLRHTLVVAEIAMSMVLLVSAGLLLRSMVRLIHVDKGFDSGHLLTMAVRPSSTRYANPRKEILYLQQMADAVNAIPGVQSAGLVYVLPLGSSSTNGPVKIEGSAGDSSNNVDKQYVGGKYFEAMRIPLRKGRWFTDADTTDSQKVVVINQAFARQFFPGQDPIGKRIDVNWGDPGWSEIVGVVGNVKQTELGAQDRPCTFMLYAQNASLMQFLDVNMVVRTSQDPFSMVQAIRSQVHQIDANQPVSDVKTMDQIVSESLAPQRAPAWLFGGFSVVALFLAAIGIYGVLSYFVVQRRQEIGVRMALGAQRSSVLALVLRQGVRLIGTGVGLGIVGAFGAARFLTSFLFGVKPTDLPTFLSVALLLAALALLACAIPALRATQVDPLVALRSE
jgi:putative ABC transport system permease protein